MSGPKIDSVELARQKQEEIRKQREERHRLLMMYQSNLLLLKETLRKGGIILTESEELQRSIGESMDEVASLNKNRNKLFSFIGHIKEDLQSLMMSVKMDIWSTNDVSDNSNSLLQKYTQTVADKLKAIQIRVEETVNNPVYTEIAAYHQSREMHQKLSKTKFTETDNIRILLPQLPAESSNHIPASSEDNSFKRYERLRPAIYDLFNHPFLSNRKRKELYVQIRRISEIIERKDYDSLNSLMDWAAVSVSAICHEADENQIAYTEFCMLWDEKEKLKGESKSPYPSFGSFRRIEDLTAKSAGLKSEIDELDKLNYIKVQVDEVMKKHGYSNLQSVVLYSQKDNMQLDSAGSHFIALSEEASHALHIRISQDGFIMMEVALSGENAKEIIKNGQPSLSKIQSEVDAAASLGAQRDFCNIHPQLIEDLRKRGVLCSNKKHNRVDAKYGIYLNDSLNPYTQITRHSQDSRRLNKLKEATINKEGNR